MRRRIGILTFHRSLNTGAYIQCFSLVKQLERDYKDCVIEVIDYYTKRVLNNYTYNLRTYLFSELKNNKYEEGFIAVIKKLVYRIIGIILNPFLLNDRKNERKLFEEAWKKLPLSQESLVSDSVEEFNKWIKGRYDIIIVGSDCIWQYCHYPFPNAFFLHDDVGAKKMSYAGCAYMISEGDLNKTDLCYIRDSLSQYEYLGVRDKWTKQLISHLDVKVLCSHNCDPAFLLDFDDIPIDLYVLKKKLESYGVDFNKKIIGLQVNSIHIGRHLRRVVDDSMQIVAIRNRNIYSDIYIKDLNPLEWSRVFSLFDVIVTDFFHGTIMSIMNGTMPVVIDSNFHLSKNKRNRTRLYDLMCRLELKEQMYVMKKRDIDEDWLKNSVYTALATDNKALLKRKRQKEARYYQNFKQNLDKLLSSY